MYENADAGNRVTLVQDGSHSEKVSTAERHWQLYDEERRGRSEISTRDNHESRDLILTRTRRTAPPVALITLHCASLPSSVIYIRLRVLCHVMHIPRYIRISNVFVPTEARTRTIHADDVIQEERKRDIEKEIWT